MDKNPWRIAGTTDGQMPLETPLHKDNRRTHSIVEIHTCSVCNTSTVPASLYLHIYAFTMKSLEAV